MIKGKLENKITELKKKLKIDEHYFSFSFRLFCRVILFLIFFLIALCFFLKSLNFEGEKTIKYMELSNLDYQVCLKSNNFYEDKCLPKDMAYVANLIDKVNINFNYMFRVIEKVDLNFKYRVTAKLLIQDESGEKTYYEKEYVLLEEKAISLTADEYAVDENIEIDYDYYNKIANSFKSNYNVSTTSSLVVYFSINKDLSKASANYFINGKESSMIVNIPLSERSINLNMNYTDINNQSDIVDGAGMIFSNILYLVISIICVIISLVFAVFAVRFLEKMFKKKSKYDSYINKILKEYDRLIVETTTSPFVTEKKITKVEKFNELLDVRDNTKEPIMYYNVVKHQKCYFYIEHNDKVFLTMIKAVDLEENK